MPIPKFYEPGPLSTKKARSSSRGKYPRLPPHRSPYQSGYSKECDQRPKAVSFNGSEASFSSQHYDSGREDLYLWQCFHVDCRLGEGSFGVVYKVQSRDDGRWYAVKEAHRQFSSSYNRQEKLQEVAKHEQLPPHPNCVRFVKAWEEECRLYIQMELCQSNLTAYAEEHHHIPERTVWDYLVDLLQGLKHLQDHNLIHLDIKPDNIFISNEGLCKLGDFGLVVRQDMIEKGKEPTEGDARYVAPELMDGNFTKAADVFSLGITILELATDLDLPGQGQHWHSLRSGTLPRDISKAMSADLRNIVERMMHPDPRQRITVNQLLAHPRIRKVLWWRRLYAERKRVVTWVCELFLLLWPWTCWMTGWLSLLRPSWLPFRRLTWKSAPHKDRSFNDSFSEDDVFEDFGLGTSSSDSRHSRAEASAFISSTPKSHWSDAYHHFRTTPHPDSLQNRSRRLANQLEDTRWSDIEPKNLFQSFEEASSSALLDL